MWKVGMIDAMVVYNFATYVSRNIAVQYGTMVIADSGYGAMAPQLARPFLGFALVARHIAKGQTLAEKKHRLAVFAIVFSYSAGITLVPNTALNAAAAGATHAYLESIAKALNLTGGALHNAKTFTINKSSLFVNKRILEYNTYCSEVIKNMMASQAAHRYMYGLGKGSAVFLVGSVTGLNYYTNKGRIGFKTAFSFSTLVFLILTNRFDKKI